MYSERSIEKMKKIIKYSVLQIFIYVELSVECYRFIVLMLSDIVCFDISIIAQPLLDFFEKNEIKVISYKISYFF